MSEKKIELRNMDPVEIFGVNDRLIIRLGGYFPKLKIIARGNAITLKGSDKDIAGFEKALERMIELRHKKRSLNIDDVDSIFETQQEMSSPGKESDIIVYGNDGKVVRARTRNQKKLVAEYYRHDLIFALGPAGTGKTYTAIALAVRALKNREVKKLILTRPAVEAGERLENADIMDFVPEEYIGSTAGRETEEGVSGENREMQTENGAENVNENLIEVEEIRIGE